LSDLGDSVKKAHVIGILILLVLVIIVGIFLFKQPTYQPGPPQEHIRGSGNLTILEFSDFQCPFCKAVHPTLDQLLDDYNGRVQILFNHFPLPSHQYSQKAAEAAECAADQGKFWEYHDKLFANQDKLYMNALKNYAAELGLDRERFSACLDSGVMASRVSMDKQEGLAKGVSGTPTFFIGNQKISGNQPISVFRSAIDRVLGEQT